MITLTLALLLPALGARAEVREIKSMSEIVSEVRPTTLLVFDLDNTVIEPVGNIGSDQWYDYALTALRRDGLDEAAAEKEAGALWTRMLGVVKVKPVEELTPRLLREKQKRGLKLLALTGRGSEDAAATFAQLKAIGLDLSSSAVSPDNFSFGNNSLYSRGVFFVGDGDKGKALLALLEKIKLRPTRVVYVDDKPRHAKAVDAAMTAAGIPCVAFRYGASDEKVRAFKEVMSEASDARSAALLFHGRETPR